MAENGPEGINKLDQHIDIEIVISDMKMPGMNGIEFIKLAKDKYPKIVYFILTGFDITKEISEALNNKLIKKYFKKPFDLEDIELTIENV